MDRTGSTSTIELVPYSQAYQAGFEDMRRRVPDIAKIEKFVGWRPRRSLEQILDDTIDEARTRLLAGPLADGVVDLTDDGIGSRSPVLR